LPAGQNGNLICETRFEHCLGALREVRQRLINPERLVNIDIQ